MTRDLLFDAMWFFDAGAWSNKSVPNAPGEDGGVSRLISVPVATTWLPPPKPFWPRGGSGACFLLLVRGGCDKA